MELYSRGYSQGSHAIVCEASLVLLACSLDRMSVCTVTVDAIATGSAALEHVWMFRDLQTQTHIVLNLVIATCTDSTAKADQLAVLSMLVLPCKHACLCVT